MTAPHSTDLVRLHERIESTRRRTKWLCVSWFLIGLMLGITIERILQ